MDLIVFLVLKIGKCILFNVILFNGSVNLLMVFNGDKVCIVFKFLLWNCLVVFFLNICKLVLFIILLVCSLNIFLKCVLMNL